MRRRCLKGVRSSDQAKGYLEHSLQKEFMVQFSEPEQVNTAGRGAPQAGQVFFGPRVANRGLSAAE